MGRRGLGRRRNLGIGSQSYIPDSTNLLYGFSFRQLIPSATLCLKIYNSNFSSFQDIGFVDGYVDTPAIISFSNANVGNNGGKTFFEWFDQFSNTLKYVAYSSFSRPVLTASAGNLNLINDKITSFPEPFGLVVNNAVLPDSSHSFQVASSFGALTGTASRMLNSTVSGRLLGAMDNTTSSASTNLAGVTYWKNGIETGTTRIALRNAIADGNISQHTARNIPTINFGSPKTIVKGYNTNLTYPPLQNTYEEIWGNAATMTTAQVTALELNQQQYYL